jgi:peptidoglycan/LPS O-acetylase OafA/YrhL
MRPPRRPYVTNWYLVSGDQSYFDTIDRQSPLLHLWSLAVEAFLHRLPVALGLVLRFAGRRGAFAATSRPPRIGGLDDRAVRSQGDPSRVYYGTDTRIVGPLVGAVLAFAMTARGRARPRADLADLAAIAALGSLAGIAITMDAADPSLYLGGLGHCRARQRGARGCRRASGGGVRPVAPRAGPGPLARHALVRVYRGIGRSSA